MMIEIQFFNGLWSGWITVLDIITQETPLINLYPESTRDKRRIHFDVVLLLEVTDCMSQ
jgi:hypothetical protein